jgi:hypothetical protein
MPSQTHEAKQVVIFIDQQQIKIEHRDYTPRQLLTLAGEDPNETTLVRKHGHELEKLINVDQLIEVKSGTHFVVFHNAPTPVS